MSRPAPATPVSLAPAQRPRVGISACLVGQQVRFDGQHKRDAYACDILGTVFDYLPLCPEVAIGLGIPRSPIRLTGSLQSTRVTGVRDPSLDVTEALEDYAGRVSSEHASTLCGYILKKGSPSCGMQRVKVYADQGPPLGAAAGKYAERLMALQPLLPCEEEGRLNDASLRESFVERVYVMQRWRALLAAGLSAGRLVDFHTRHKFLALSHAEVEYRAMGRLIAGAGRADLPALAGEYIALLMRALTRRATRRRHSNVLHHLLGHLRGTLDASARAELAELIDEYRQGHVPLVVPVRFLKYHFRRHPDDFVAMQYYLEPYPDSLGLRNHL